MSHLPVTHQPIEDGEKEEMLGNGAVEEAAPEEADDYEVCRETRCSACGYGPAWLQILASKKTYVLVYGILGMNQSALGSYFIGTLSTIEKRFKIPSTKTGIIASAWDIGALSASMVLAYFGSRGHKTRWVAIGAAIAALSCFLRFIPHSVYGPGPMPPSDNSTLNSSFLCGMTHLIEDNCTLESDGYTSFLILLFAHIMIGVGTCTYYTLGVAYLDDNALKNKMPFLFALSTSIRGIGPTVGFIWAYFALKIFINPSVEPSFNSEDPRWIGAWWYGWIPMGIIHLVFSSVMTFFPRTLPREHMRRKSSAIHWTKQKNKKSFSDFLTTMKRLSKNPILMFNSFSSTFYIFGMIAYWIFMPKYIETQFRVSAANSSFITGTVGLVSLGLGVLSSGAIISIFKPRPRYLAAWNIFTESIDTVGHLLFAFLGCPKFDLHGDYGSSGSWNLTAECNAGCDCGLNIEFNPVCSYDNTTTFYSPCHAGCTDFFKEGKKKIYTNCSCIEGEGMAMEGQCPVDCFNQFLIFLILLSLMKFLASTGRAGNTIIQFRSVKPEDKSISIALTEALLCIVTFIPAPILFGYILDYSCLVWGYSCDEPGNCWLYEGRLLRYLLNFTASSFLLIATLLDVGVFMNVGNLQIYDEEETSSDKKPEDKSLNNSVIPLNSHVQQPLTSTNNK